MNDFERVIVKSFNAYFKQNSIHALSYRLKQSRFFKQFLDVLVDSINPDLYMGIECKSISVEKGASALYFSQHFTVDKKGVHQIERITDYLNSTGRRGYLAVELRMGVGHGRQAYMIPWNIVEKRYLDQNLKIRIDEIRTYPEMKRAGSLYMVSDIILENESTHKMPCSLQNVHKYLLILSPCEPSKLSTCKYIRITLLLSPEPPALSTGYKKSEDKVNGTKRRKREKRGSSLFCVDIIIKTNAVLS